MPASVTALRAAAAEADATLVVTPEYNGSIPAVIKNAIDWLSRPFGDGALKDKPLAVIGGSYGQYGGVWAHDETRKSFGIAGPRVVESIKLSVPFGSLNGQASAGARRDGFQRARRGGQAGRRSGLRPACGRRVMPAGRILSVLCWVDALRVLCRCRVVNLDVYRREIIL